MAAAPVSAPANGWRALGHGAIFLLAFALSCGVLGRWLPFPEVPVVREKVEHLARYGDDYDVLFIGSSRVQFQIMPSVFDRVAGEGGISVKSFNAGVAAMWSPEDGYVLEEILRHPHRRLRWVFIELSRLGTGAEREALARSIYWHDTPRLRLLARRLWGQWGEARERLSYVPDVGLGPRWDAFAEPAARLLEHTRQWLMRAVNLGRAVGLLTHWETFGKKKRKAGAKLGEHGDGWTTAGRSRQQMSGEVRQKYERTYAERLTSPAGREPGDPVSQEALERTIAAVLRSGATPVLVVPPTTYEQNFYPRPERVGELLILDFSDVRQYPELFSPEHRLDLDHVNTAGARAFSVALATRFLEVIRAEKPAR
jgi:hypothetical protein